jgi:hypothetical protein
MPTSACTYSPDWKKPISFCFWGDSLGDQCRPAWAVPRKINPDPYWLQVEDPVGACDPGEPSVPRRSRPPHVDLPRRDRDLCGGILKRTKRRLCSSFVRV